jgi:hypothetical protein
VRTFKLSNDPKFEEKFWDVIGLYLDPPAKALRREEPMPGSDRRCGPLRELRLDR